MPSLSPPTLDVAPFESLDRAGVDDLEWTQARSGMENYDILIAGNDV